jgi:membrane protease YdiL (CAAX protease family)
MSAPAETAAAVETPLGRRTLVAEVWLVLGVSLGASAIYAALDLVRDLARHVSLSNQVTTVVGSQAQQHWLDLLFQVAGIVTGVVPAALAVYLLFRSGESNRTIGLDSTRPRFDLGYGALLAAVIGGAGLSVYLIAHALGIALTVDVSNLPAVWWRDAVLVLSAAQNAILEEVVVLGYLLHRLRQLGWRDEKALVASALLRGSYHLYQGFGGFLGNAVMGLIFGRLFQRWQRVGPFIVAHTLIDAVSFVGYVHLAGHVSWLPTP